MDLTLLHPKVVHIPIALAVLMPLLTSGLLLAWWRGWLPRTTWIIAVLFQAVLVSSAYVALETGEADEEIVETVVAERHIETHEEAAEAFTWAAAFALVLFIVAAVPKNERVAKTLGGLSLLATVVVFGMGYRVGEAGGALVYEHGAASAFTQPGVGTMVRADLASPEREDDD